MTPQSTLSIVVPTRDRPVRVAALLRELEAMPGCGEIVIVDDGGVPPLALGEETGHSAAVTVLRHETARGPAAARNAGWRRAQGDVVLFLDDDVTPLPGALEAHAAFHRGADGAAKSVRIGRIGWPHEPAPNPFMLYLTESPYGAFNPARPAPKGQEWRRLTTSAVSLGRALLEETGGFDESFVKPWGEDFEFGRRLAAAGARFVCDEESSFLHHKAYALADYCETLRRNAPESIRLELKCDPNWKPPALGCTFEIGLREKFFQLALEMEAEWERHADDVFGRLGLRNALWEIYRAATALAHNQAMAEAWEKRVKGEGRRTRGDL